MRPQSLWIEGTDLSDETMKILDRLTNEQQHYPNSIPSVEIGRMTIAKFLSGSLKTREG